MASSPLKQPTQSEPENILPDLLELAKVSFNTVLDADKHEDEKAYRILTAIAFLTAAAAVIFAAIYQTQPSSVNKVTFNEINYAIIAFSCYIFFILIGSTLYLLALGPNLNIPAKSSLASGASKHSKVTSLLFFEEINKCEKKDWDETWYVDDTNKRIKNKEDTIKNTTILETLSEKIYLNYVKEAKLIAGKAGTTPLSGERAQASLRGRPLDRLGKVGSGNGCLRGRPLGRFGSITSASAFFRDRRGRLGWTQGTGAVL